MTTPPEWKERVSVYIIIIIIIIVFVNINFTKFDLTLRTTKGWAMKNTNTVSEIQMMLI